jgi:hypothetical protein
VTCFAESSSYTYDLFCRHDREKTGRRSALDKIVSLDSAPSAPMVLCISDIILPEDSKELPQLELSDGWYRIRTTIDQPLARAVQKGTLRVGRKLAIAGANVSPRHSITFLRCLMSQSYTPKVKSLPTCCSLTPPRSSVSTGMPVT